MPLQKLPVVGLDDVNHRRRARETINQVLDHSFDDSRAQTTAEKLAGVTPVNAAYPPGDVRRYGAVGDGVTNDKPAIDNAFLSCPLGGTVTLDANKTYSLGSGSIAIPDTKSLDTNGSDIISTGVAVLTFGRGSSLYGRDSNITGSGNSGAAIALTSTANPDSMYIYGWPTITSTNSGVAGSIGIDYTGSVRGVFEIRIAETFVINVTGGSGSATPQTYYNEFRSPKIRTVSGGTAFRTRAGCNSNTVVNPQISGGTNGTYGFDIDGTGSLTVMGGYVEAFAAANGTRGAKINDSTNISFIGVTFDQTTADATTSQALEVSGTSTQINFYGNGFGGSWGSSNRILTKSGAGFFNFIGGAPTNQVCIIGLATWAGGYLNGYTQIGDLAVEHITASAAEASGYTHTFVNSSTGPTALFRTSATSAIAGRAALTIDRVGGYGYAMNFQNNGTEAGGICFGSGTPESVVTAVVGTLYLDVSNGVAFMKKTGSGNTGWKQITQAP